jgi:hypothetical protein
LVVSWKEAAEMNESLCRDALVIPRSSGFAVAGFFFCRMSSAFSERKRNLSTTAPGRNAVARVLDPHLAHHLGEDDLDVLVVDA